MKLYEYALANREGCASPNVWRTKMLLAHLGLEVESEMLFHIELEEKLAFAQPEAERLGTKAPYAPNGTLPVLVDGDTILPDSWTIAAHLDRNYGDGSLVNAHSALAMNRFFEHWASKHIVSNVFPDILPETVNAMDEVDREPFRRSRERMFGLNFDDLNGTLKDCVPALQEGLQTLEQTLADQDYLGGESPVYADYILFGMFVWMAKVSSTEVLVRGSAVHRWRERLMDAYDGLARK